jgi:hypothetical protein
MRPFGAIRWACALVVAGIAATPAHAAWDNAFQVCCFGCKKPAVSGYAPAACCAPPACTSCAPPTCCTTQYVQRSYYQPVTCYQTQSYYQPVTSYRTSYYYEPVTSYSYSCFFDPCSCSYKQVATPQTCYQLRSQTCAVTSYLQRTCQVPVTSYQLSYYYEPVTTCSSPAPCPCPAPCQAPCQPGCAAPCSNSAAPAQAPPAVTEQPSAPPAGVQEQRAVPPAPNGNGTPEIDRRYYPAPATNPPPGASGTNYRQPAPAQQAPAPPPAVRLDRIVAVPATGNQVEGKVVLNDNRPRANARLLFVSAEKQGPQQSITADNNGRFNVTLASGDWLVYMTGTDGKPVFHSKIDISSKDTRPFVLMTR